MLGLWIWGKLTLGCWLRSCRRNTVSIPFHSSIEDADGSKNIREESMTKQGWNEQINYPFLLTGKMTLQFIVASNLLTKNREIIRQFKQERVGLFSLHSGIGDQFRVRARVVKESASKIVNFSVFLLRHFSVYMATKYSQRLNVSWIRLKDRT